jgi:hypothetical protein
MHWIRCWVLLGSSPVTKVVGVFIRFSCAASQAIVLITWSAIIQIGADEEKLEKEIYSVENLVLLHQ